MTTLPLARVYAVQTTNSWHWSAKLLVAFGVALYVLPGIIALMFLLRMGGPEANVVAGALRIELRFSPSPPSNIQEFIGQLDRQTSFRLGTG